MEFNSYSQNIELQGVTLLDDKFSSNTPTFYKNDGNLSISQNN